MTIDGSFTNRLLNGGLPALLAGGLLVATNFELGPRLMLLIEQGRLGTMAVTLAIWAISIAAIAAACMHPWRAVRYGWVLLLSLSTAVLMGYHAASQSELTIFDALSLWEARHEAGGATQQYRTALIAGVLWFAISCLILALLHPIQRRIPALAKTALAFVPLIPVAIIAAAIMARGGNGSTAMPKQVLGYSFAALAAHKLAFDPQETRASPLWAADKSSAVRRIVVVVDESIRPDYLDATPGNPFTPGYSKVASHFADFGPTASGAICSNYANALLRNAVTRKAVVETANSGPALFEYAKHAGYRTVYIDGQAGNVSAVSHLQNFMTLQERSFIDGFHPITGVDRPEADAQVLETIARELQQEGPVFIFANKLGAHFPYESIVPEGQNAIVADAGSEAQEVKIAAYRSAVAWGTDRFFEKLPAVLAKEDIAFVYTSDHGQLLDPDRLTHCVVENPDPRMALVPLLGYASNDALQAELNAGAAVSRGKASHFQIAPTLLSWMGYNRADIATRYDESLTQGPSREPAYTVGDIFGLFSENVIWHGIDLNASYLEQPELSNTATNGIANATNH
jgi:lipid A ethanolaminephosphotransferase